MTDESTIDFGNNTPEPKTFPHPRVFRYNFFSATLCEALNLDRHQFLFLLQLCEYRPGKAYYVTVQRDMMFKSSSLRNIKFKLIEKGYLEDSREIRVIAKFRDLIDYLKKSIGDSHSNLTKLLYTPFDGDGNEERIQEEIRDNYDKGNYHPKASDLPHNT